MRRKNCGPQFTDRGPLITTIQTKSYAAQPRFSPVSGCFGVRVKARLRVRFTIIGVGLGLRLCLDIIGSDF